MQDRDHVIIVDDEHILRESLKEWLEEDGFRVSTAGSGMEALKIIEEQNPMVAVIDIKMPGIDGITLLRKLKEMDINIPIIMITAYATVENAVQSMKEGAYDFLTKPFPPEKLSKLLHNVIDHQKLKQENIRLRKERQHILQMAISAFITVIVLGIIIFYFFG